MWKNCESLKSYLIIFEKVKRKNQRLQFYSVCVYTYIFTRKKKLKNNSRGYCKDTKIKQPKPI